MHQGARRSGWFRQSTILEDANPRRLLAKKKKKNHTHTQKSTEYVSLVDPPTPPALARHVYLSMPAESDSWLRSLIGVCVEAGMYTRVRRDAVCARLRISLSAWADANERVRQFCLCQFRPVSFTLKITT